MTADEHGPLTRDQRIDAAAEALWAMRDYGRRDQAVGALDAALADFGGFDGLLQAVLGREQT